MQQMHPTNMLGMEMNIIAGVVLGGVALTGGAGTLTGCILGYFPDHLVQNSHDPSWNPTTWSEYRRTCNRDWSIPDRMAVNPNL